MTDENYKKGEDFVISDKKDKEKLCLDKVINAGRLLHGESKRIIKK